MRGCGARRQRRGKRAVKPRVRGLTGKGSKTCDPNRSAALQQKSTLLLPALLRNPTCKHLHFLHRLLVAFTLGGSNAIAPRLQRFVAASGGKQGFAEQLPGSGITGIERDCPPKMVSRARGIAELEVFVAKT